MDKLASIAHRDLLIDAKIRASIGGEDDNIASGCRRDSYVGTVMLAAGVTYIDRCDSAVELEGGKSFVVDQFQQECDAKTRAKEQRNNEPEVEFTVLSIFGRGEILAPKCYEAEDSYRN